MDIFNAIKSILVAGSLVITGGSLGGGPGTINQLSQWVSTSSPSTAITQSIYGNDIKITGLSTGDCLTLDANELLATTTCGAGGGSGTVTSVGLATPTGFTVSGSPVTTAGTLTIGYDTGYEGLLSASSTNWNTFYDTPSDRITAGNHIDWTGNTLNVITTGDWTGTFDGQEGSYYSDAENLNNFGIPFYTFFSATNTDALSEGATNFYYTETRFDTSLIATTSLPHLTVGTSSTSTISQSLEGFDQLDYLSLVDWYATTTDQLSEGLNNLYYTDARVNSYIHSSTTIPKTYTENTFTNVGTTTFAGTIAVSSTTATSTFANGIDLANGCFAINGTCLSTGGGGGSTLTLKESTVQLGGSDIATLDFGTGFDLTESPDTEINVDLDLDEWSDALTESNTPQSGDMILWQDVTANVFKKFDVDDAHTALGFTVSNQYDIAFGDSDNSIKSDGFLQYVDSSKQLVNDSSVVGLGGAINWTISALAQDGLVLKPVAGTYTGDYLDFLDNSGTSVFSVESDGELHIPGTIETGSIGADDYIPFIDDSQGSEVRKVLKGVFLAEIGGGGRSGGADAGEVIFSDGSGGTDSEAEFLYESSKNKLTLGETVSGSDNFHLEVSSGSAQQAWPGINIIESSHVSSGRATIGFGLNSTTTPDQGFLQGRDWAGTDAETFYLYSLSGGITSMYVDGATGYVQLGGGGGNASNPLSAHTSLSGDFVARVQNTHASGDGLLINTAGTTGSESSLRVSNNSTVNFDIHNDGDVSIGQTANTLGILEITADADTMDAGGHDHAVPLWMHVDYAQGQMVIDGQAAGSDLAYTLQETSDVDNSGQIWLGMFKNGAYGPTGTSGIVSAKNGTGTTRDLILLSNDNALATPQVTVQANTSFVGINKASPTVALDVVGSGAISTDLIVDGNVGIGTTSPYAKLSVVGEVVASHFTGTTTATSTFGGGIDISTGCFAVAGTCLSTGGGSSLFTDNGAYLTPTGNEFLDVSYYVATSSSATSTFAGGIQAQTNGFVYDLSTKKVGIGTASPDSYLHLYADNSDTTTTLSRLEQDGTGDASVTFELTGLEMWGMGVDNSDSDSFKISMSQDIGIDPKLILDNSLVRFPDFTTDGFVTFSSSNGTLAVDTSTYITATLTQEEVEDYAGTLIADGTGTHTGIAVTYQDATGDVDFVVDHDAASNFVSNEHIDHTSVTLTAGTGLSGGGDISTSRSFAVDLDELTTETTIASGDFLAMVDITDSGSGKITFANFEGTISHDNLSGFVSNEHLDWTAVSAGTIDISNIQDASTSQQGVVELTTSAEVNTGTDTTRAITADALAGSNIGVERVQSIVFDFTTDISTGDGKFYIEIPDEYDGMNLIRARARVITAGTTGSTDIQVHNVTDAVDMLSSKMIVASAGTSDEGVVNGSNDDVATDDLLRIDVDAVSTTAPKGLLITLAFQLP